VLSGWVTQGPAVEAFERKFAAAVGAPFACAVSNCTAALHMALLGVGVSLGDVVLTVSHSFIATANAVRCCGAEPVFVDIDLQTLNIDPDRLEETVERDFERKNDFFWHRAPERLITCFSPFARCAPPLGRLAAILVVHQAGMPADLRRILPLAQKWGLPVVEDAACAVGSEIKRDPSAPWERIGKPHGNVACFSFHPRKILTTGDGGMLVTASRTLYERFRLLRQHGMSVPDTVRHSVNQVLFESYVLPAFNYRMTDIQAAVGCKQLDRLDAIIEKRRFLAGEYQRQILGIPGVEAPKEPEYARSNWQSFIVRLQDASLQTTVMQRLLDMGVSTRRGIMCAHLEPAYAGIFVSNGLEGSLIARDTGIILPLFHGMEVEDVNYVAMCLRNALQV